MILGVERVKKSFDGFVAINGVSFSIPKGEICSIIGPNGAGKTTLFNLITGHLPIDEGNLTFKDLDITNRPPHQICRLGIGRSFQRTNIFPRLTVFQNIQAAVLAHRGKSFTFFRPVDSFFQEETGEILGRVGLEEYAQTVSGSLSYGFQKQLELGIALASEPELLLLDEPTAGMSAQETHQTMELIGTNHPGERAHPSFHGARYGGGLLHLRTDHGPAPGTAYRRRDVPKRSAIIPKSRRSTWGNGDDS